MYICVENVKIISRDKRFTRRFWWRSRECSSHKDCPDGQKCRSACTVMGNDCLIGVWTGTYACRV